MFCHGPGQARRNMAGLSSARLGRAWRGVARRGTAGIKAWFGTAKRGVARLGGAWHGFKIQ
jgi:hypothetical protein